MPGTTEAAAFAAARRGDHGPVLGLAALPDSDPRAAWSLAARAAIDLATGAPPARAVVDLVVQLESMGDADVGARPAAAIAGQLLLRRAILAFDVEGVHAAARLCADMAGPHARMQIASAELWASYAAADWPAVERRATLVHGLAEAAEVAELQIEARALRAWALHEGGQLTAALDDARAASRAGRAHRLPQAEYLANLVLARLRRYDGAAYLSMRILNALAPVAPWMWRGWLSVESAMASSGLSREGPKPRVRSQVAAQALNHAFAEARSGDRVGFERTLTRLRRVVGDWSPLGRDVATLAGACDPALELDPPRALLQWRRGERDGYPPGLGPALVSADELGGGWVLVQTESGPARVAGCSVSLHRDPGTSVLEPGRAGQRRVETLLAVLALAGAEGLPEAELFARVYGFRYVAELHGGTFGVLVHRARERGGSALRIERASGRVRLEPLVERLLAHDPRCTSVGQDRVLRYLATNPATTARAISRALEIPLRTVQASLKELVEQEVCDSARRGREWVYRVEDTTFREPTTVPLPPDVDEAVERAQPM